MLSARRLTPILVVLLVIAGTAASIRWLGQETRQDRPATVDWTNVLLISIDTLRADRLNCYADQRRELTPHIDRLAADAVLFENAFAQSPWTTPSHFSLLTGLYPSAHGMNAPMHELLGSGHDRQTALRLADEHVTLAELLQEQGRTTAAFTAGLTLDPRFGFDQGFDRYGTSMFKLTTQNMASLETWLDDHASQPFFLFWHTFEVHAPYHHADFVGEVLPDDKAQAVRRFLGDYRRSLGPDAPEAAGHEKTCAEHMAFLKQQGAFTPATCRALYDAGVRSADRAVGRIIDRLRSLGLYDHTLIVLTSDHGEEFAEHDKQRIYNCHGHTVYDEMIHVPLIVKLPRQHHAGRCVAEQVRLIDVMPTILDELKLDVPSSGGLGRSLAGLLDRDEAADRVSFTEATVGEEEIKCVRALDHKYICTMSPAQVAEQGRSAVADRPHRVELYDLRADPRERHNLLETDPARAADWIEQLDPLLRRHASRRKLAPEPTDLDADTIRRLKGLGYVK